MFEGYEMRMDINRNDIFGDKLSSVCNGNWNGFRVFWFGFKYDFFVL